MKSASDKSISIADQWTPSEKAARQCYVPLLSIVMDPVTAGGLLALLFVAMDLFALPYWKFSTWSKPDLVLLLPGLVIAAIGPRADGRRRASTAEAAAWS